MTKSPWADFFDGHAPVYDENCFTKNTLFEVGFLIRELALDPGAAILDIGCGTGRHAVELARQGFRVTGLDISIGMLEQARQKAHDAGVTVNWIQSDANRFSLPGMFDAVICLCEGAFGLLGSGDDPIGQPLAILRNASTAMKPGGRCLFTVLNALCLIRKYNKTDIENKLFDPLMMSEVSECAAPEGPIMRERAFVPTELTMLGIMAGLEIQSVWGGTAGNWGHRSIDPDEIEIMFTARKPA